MVRYISQQEARQQQAEKRIAEYKASEADWRERLRVVQEKLEAAEKEAAEMKAALAETCFNEELIDERDRLRAALQGKDEAIAELRAELENAREVRSADAAEGAERLAELSRKLEALTEDRRVQRVRAADAEIALTEERSLTAELRGKLEAAELSALSLAADVQRAEAHGRVSERDSVSLAEHPPSLPQRSRSPLTTCAPSRER